VAQTVGTGRGRILIVDDDEGIRRFCLRIFEGEGYEVESASDGAEAVERIANRFDVIVSDIQMPGMDGLQLLRAVRERDLDVPVILMTGNPTLQSAMRAIEYGALRYLSKPFATEELLQLVEEAVRLRKLAALKREALELLGAQKKLVGDRAGLEATFARAIESLSMAYQPIIAYGGRRIFGYEALLRSGEPMLPHPGAILDAAERLDRLHLLGRVIRNKVAGTIIEHPGEAVFFVNLHSFDLLDDTLFSPGSQLSKVASRVVLEITERASLDDVKDVRARMRALRDLGFRTAIDDLGAGYAGLNSFANVEPDLVKIDMGLIRGIDADPLRRKIVEKMTALAHDLDILVVAEGIETAAERDVVASMGCDYLQGYLFAKPGPPFPDVKY